MVTSFDEAKGSIGTERDRGREKESRSSQSRTTTPTTIEDATRGRTSICTERGLEIEKGFFSPLKNKSSGDVRSTSENGSMIHQRRSTQSLTGVLSFDSNSKIRIKHVRTTGWKVEAIVSDLARSTVFHRIPLRLGKIRKRKLKSWTMTKRRSRKNNAKISES